jgi:hypothetical protein
MILMHLEKASRETLAEAVERAWRLVAPAKLVRQRDQLPES